MSDEHKPPPPASKPSLVEHAGTKALSSGRDVAVVVAATEDGKGARIVRSREGRIEIGELRAAEEGKPLQGRELIRLKPQVNAEGDAKVPVYDVEVVHPGTAIKTETEDVTQRPGQKPAQVTSPAYRESWDRIFGDAKRLPGNGSGSLN
jgi:hypothetical protein